MDVATHFVISAGVKMDYGGYQNRVDLFGNWWTLPVKKGAKDQALKEVRYEPSDLLKVTAHGRHMLCGKKWPFADRVDAILKLVEKYNTGYLYDVNFSALFAIKGELGITTEIIANFDRPFSDLSKTENLLRRTGITGFENDSYLAGSGTLGYLDHKVWPPKCKVLAQDRTKDVDTGTVLQLISRHERPMDVIRSSFSWRLIDGLTAAPQENSGDRAAL